MIDSKNYFNKLLLVGKYFLIKPCLLLFKFCAVNNIEHQNISGFGFEHELMYGKQVISNTK